MTGIDKWEHTTREVLANSPSVAELSDIIVEAVVIGRRAAAIERTAKRQIETILSTATEAVGAT